MELMKTNKLQSVSKIINDILKNDGILCFGEQSLTFSNNNVFQRTPFIQNKVHYHLLVISDAEIEDILQLETKINSQLDHSSSISLFIHTETEIIRALACNSRFFHKIFQQADQMYLQSHYKIQFGDMAVTEPADALMIWQEHYNKAVMFLESAGNLLGIDDNSASLYLIIECLEHACAGLLQSCLDYQPKHTDLTYVLPVCNILSSQLESIFPRKTPVDESHFQLLSKSKRLTGKGTVMPEDSFTVFFLHQQCVEWIKAARQVVEQARHAGHM
ncbi:hypothetical protein [Pedobacter ginsengisoli]|uniref:hypothetical protein n=1 Tax=Pedobacter ginsengisoli TaxID=363852 RepID=UPI0025512A3F|nr:hypothetical protein [Pedobacter ginsengisoli]